MRDGRRVSCLSKRQLLSRRKCVAEFFFNYGLFVAKLMTVVVAILAVTIVSITLGMRAKQSRKGHIEVTKVNEEIDHMRLTLNATVVDPDTFKLQLKRKKQADKIEHKTRKKELKKAAKSEPAKEPGADTEPRVFVLDFDGDLRASAVSCLRREITAVLSLAGESDEVVVRVESSGGIVHAYGLASSQLQRIKEHGVALTVCVDKVAASGGYMMACVANKLLAAPFAVIGSIGVVAQLPNFHRLLKKHDVDLELITAGEHKRTLTMLGKNTQKGREKFTEEIEDVHLLFKEFVTQHRPQVKIEEVATGEIWFGQRALDKLLVDELITSDEYIARACEKSDVFEVKYVDKKSLPEKLAIAIEASVDGFLMKWWDRGTKSRFHS